MKSPHYQFYENMLTVDDEILFRKTCNKGPKPGTLAHEQKRNHPWRTRGFVGRKEKDERLTITDDGWKWGNMTSGDSPESKRRGQGIGQGERTGV